MHYITFFTFIYLFFPEMNARRLGTWQEWKVRTFIATANAWFTQLPIALKTSVNAQHSSHNEKLMFMATTFSNKCMTVIRLANKTDKKAPILWVRYFPIGGAALTVISCDLYNWDILIKKLSEGLFVYCALIMFTWQWWEKRWEHHHNIKAGLVLRYATGKNGKLPKACTCQVFVQLKLHYLMTTTIFHHVWWSPSSSRPRLRLQIEEPAEKETSLGTRGWCWQQRGKKSDLEKWWIGIIRQHLLIFMDSLNFTALFRLIFVTYFDFTKFTSTQKRVHAGLFIYQNR